MFADPNFSIVDSNTASRLAGLPAYSLEYTTVNSDDNSTYRTLEFGTIISGKVLFIDFILVFL